MTLYLKNDLLMVEMDDGEIREVSAFCDCLNDYLPCTERVLSSTSLVEEIMEAYHAHLQDEKEHFIELKADARRDWLEHHGVIKRG